MTDVGQARVTQVQNLATSGAAVFSKYWRLDLDIVMWL